MSIPPTPTPALPAAPSKLSETNICEAMNTNMWSASGTLSWQDNSNNEDGFNIYWIEKNIQNSKDWLIGTVGPNTTSFNFSQGHFYIDAAYLKVESFNSAGASSKISLLVNIVNCPPNP